MKDNSTYTYWTTPTKGIAVGLCVPEKAVTDDLILSTYNSGTDTWTEVLRIKNATGDLFMEGDADFDNDISTGNDLVVGNDLTVNNNATISGGLAVDSGITTGQITLSGGTALSNYVTGTFTPVVRGGSTAGTATYAKQVGRYTRIGNRVFFSIHLGWSGHTGTGGLEITGLPITSASATNSHSTAVCQYDGLTVGAGLQINAYIGPSTTTILFATSDPSGGGAGGISIDADVSTLIITGSYEV